MKQDNQGKDATPAVVYFDATTRRKEKMRLASAMGSVPTGVTAEEAVAVPKASTPTRVPPSAVAPVPPIAPVAPAPVAPAPVAPAAVAPAAVAAASLVEPTHLEDKSASNGAGSVSSAAPDPASGTGLNSESLSSFLVNFVVEHTGYPPEIVEMDADLEADLGIDSIKVAQMFGELRERFGVGASDDVGLDDFPTLQHVMDYLLPS